MSWMQTYSGHKFSLLEDEYAFNAISIVDIAHALSQVNRFGGHTKKPYSVAQHSVLVSYACPTKPLAGLLHDASEAYLGDVVTQLKQQLQDYKRMERALSDTIAFRFNMGDSDFDDPEVKHADMMLLATEKRDVLKHNDLFWSINLPDPAAEKINFISAFEAKRMFLNRFFELTGVAKRWKEQDEEDMKHDFEQQIGKA